MTHENLTWIMRHPGDELVLTNVTLNRIGAALMIATTPGEGIRYMTDHDQATGRQVRVPVAIGAKKITLRDPQLQDMSGDWIHIRLHGKRHTTIFLPNQAGDLEEFIHAFA